MSPKDLGQMALGALIGGGGGLFGGKGGKAPADTPTPSPSQTTKAPAAGAPKSGAKGFMGALPGFTQMSQPGKSLLGQ